MKLIKLANAETLAISINFLTIKKLGELGVMGMDFKSQDPAVQIELASKLIYAVIYSSGKTLTMDDCLSLVPIGEDDVFESLFEEFRIQMEAFEKKTESRAQLNKVLKK